MSIRVSGCVVAIGIAVVSSVFAADEKVGKRPYEMEWAGRTSDIRAALIDFENLDGWTVETQQAEARLELSREEQLWGNHVAKLTYRGTGVRPVVTVRPPQPVPVKGPFDCVNFWVCGNNWAWVPDTTTPQVDIAVVLQGKDGKSVRMSMGRVRWREWWVMHRRLTAEQLALLGGSVSVAAIEVAGGRNTQDRVLHFDNLAVYRESLAPLQFQPRPERNVKLPPGQTVGTNTGPGVLPFPTREKTILPDNLTKDFRVSMTHDAKADAYEFHYRGADGHLVYTYRPKAGTLSDLTAQWEGRTDAFRPMADGGVWFTVGPNAKAAPAERLELLECVKNGEVVRSRWKCQFQENAAEILYTFRLWQKSLVIDVQCPGGMASEVRFGRAEGVAQPRLVTLPYLVCDNRRPAVLVMGPADKPCFLMGLVDYYRSNASELWANNEVEGDRAVYNGGARYLNKTDGRRNDCYERLFLTVSPRFEEVLPNIANPRSPWMHIAGERVWRAHGASNRERDYEQWKKVARYGMSKILITDHETGWRDGGESFTLRTKAAPGRGGDESQFQYARKIQALGFRYGIYNNYTDFAPVNEFWNEDYVTRLPDGDWRPAWARCYNLKPSRAVELEAKLAEIIQEKFQLDTAYCDVHTAVRPWQYCDYDARVPGGGTFAATFYAYGEIMLHQKKTWNGPVYSEGNNHWYYCGLTDGNYGQDQQARLAENPWLVDFDLRKLHPLCCNFGMGNLEMFYTRNPSPDIAAQELEARIDRFLAATLAFGHTGFLVMEGGMPNAVKSYFSVQQVHARYAQDTADSIRYADAAGKLFDTSAAVAADVYRRSQILTTYRRGLEVFVNGHPNDSWNTPHGVLPPNGWHAKHPHGDLVAWSKLVEGHRADYVDSPAYVYADGRGVLTRFPKATADGQLIILPRADGTKEVIPVGKCRVMGVSLDGSDGTADALDEERQSLGPAETRISRGQVFITPRSNAFSYVLKPKPAPAVSLSCTRTTAAPGEAMAVQGRQQHTFTIPRDAKIGSQEWAQLEGAWIDWTVTPLADTTLNLDKGLHLTLTSRLAQPADAEIAIDGQARRARLMPGQAHSDTFPLTASGKQEVRKVPLRVTVGSMTMDRNWWFKAEEAIVPIAKLDRDYVGGQRLRGKEEEPLSVENSAQVATRDCSCGGLSEHGVFMHPPYRGGVGYACALFKPVKLPPQFPAAVRARIGKTDGSDRGDGILFQIAVVDESGKSTIVAEKQWAEHAWMEIEGDLSPWKGKQVRIKIISDVGPGDNSSGDWACWTDVRVESRSWELNRSVHETEVALAHEDAPDTLADLTLPQLRTAKSGWLHYEGCGLQCSGEYISTVALNRAALGKLPAAGGNETAGTWSTARVPLTPEAIAALGEFNTVRIDNPGQDSFKVRRFRIELELADGRKCSSQVSATAYTQPANWLHREGIGVAFGKPIEIQVRFRLKR